MKIDSSMQLIRRVVSVLSDKIIRLDTIQLMKLNRSTERARAMKLTYSALPRKSSASKFAC